MAGGLIGIGKWYQQQGMQMMGLGASLQESRESTAEQIEAAKRTGKRSSDMSTVGLGMTAAPYLYDKTKNLFSAGLGSLPEGLTPVTSNPLPSGGAMNVTGSGPVFNPLSADKSFSGFVSSPSPTVGPLTNATSSSVSVPATVATENGMTAVAQNSTNATASTAGNSVASGAGAGLGSAVGGGLAGAGVGLGVTEGLKALGMDKTASSAIGGAAGGAAGVAVAGGLAGMASGAGFGAGAGAAMGSWAGPVGVGVGALAGWLFSELF